MRLTDATPAPCKLSMADISAVSIAFTSVPQVLCEDGTVRFSVLVRNDSKQLISSTGEFPVRLSAFLLPVGTPEPYVGDFLRDPQPLEIHPNCAKDFDMILAAPESPGRYALVVTLVQEGVAWFHLAKNATAAVTQLDYASPLAWWSKDEQRDVLFGNVEELNRLKFRSLFGCGNMKRPLFLHCETVNICNLRCVICPYNEMTRKKETMSEDLFQKVIADYCMMGGGDVALTPSVGDVFLDKNLVDRIRHLRSRPEIKSIGFVTNAGNAGAFSDEELSYVVNNCKRINVSIYGLDEEETAAMTRREDQYKKIVEQIHRIIRVNDGSCRIVFAFRLLKANAQQRASSWMVANFGDVFPNEVLTEFSNWAGAIDTSLPLPFAGAWMSVARDDNHSACAYPLMHCKVSVNGDVKFCSCIDYNSAPENILGNVSQASLLDIYNGQRAKELWREGLSICRGCTHAVPIAKFLSNFVLMRSPIEHLGV